MRTIPYYKAWILIPLLSITTSCATTKEYIVHVPTGQKMVGYNKDCLYQIGKTPKAAIKKAVLDSLEKDGLTLSFAYASGKPDDNVLVAAWGVGNYSSAHHVNPGDPWDKAQKIYGKPRATMLRYWQDEKHGIDWRFEGLFYPDLAILPDSSKSEVGAVIVGKMFDVDPKYIVK